jgi:hypothetical protein
VGDGLPVILVVRSVMIEKGIQPQHPFRHCFYSLQANRDAVVGEGELDLGKIGLAAKISVLTPYPIEYG